MIWERVKLNTIGQEDGASIRLICDSITAVEIALSGQVEVRVNGKQVILATNLTLRSSPEAKIQGLHFETFFGGMSSPLSHFFVSFRSAYDVSFHPLHVSLSLALVARWFY